MNTALHFFTQQESDRRNHIQLMRDAIDSLDIAKADLCLAQPRIENFENQADYLKAQELHELVKQRINDMICNLYDRLETEIGEFK